MYKPTPEEIAEILAKHKRWLEESEGWSEDDRADLHEADLSGADLHGADLHGADLSEADLRWADLSEADLSGADLSGADLRWADLRWADLSEADLHGADLSEADLRWADLSEADLRWADLHGADLHGADLSEADLRWADLRWADLSEADLRWADLSEADLSGADLRWADLHDLKHGELALAMTEIVPREGSFVGWKKCRAGSIVRLRIPEDAKRSNATGRKCRASKAEVLAIYDADGSPQEEATSDYDEGFVYRVGEVVEVEDFYEDRLRECAAGIHFYLTREEAEAHY